MNFRPGFLWFCLVSAFALHSIVVAPAMAGPALSGAYRLTENTDLGSQVRITVQFTFMNATTAPVTLTKLGLPAVSAPGKQVTGSSTVVVGARASSEVSVQFLLSKKDFQTWYVGPQQQFLITFKSSTGKYTSLNLPLLRMRA